MGRDIWNIPCFEHLLEVSFLANLGAGSAAAGFTKLMMTMEKTRMMGNGLGRKRSWIPRRLTKRTSSWSVIVKRMLRREMRKPVTVARRNRTVLRLLS